MPPSEEIKDALKTALFDCSPLSDSDILALLEWMYHDFGLPEKFHIDSRTIRAFLYEVYKNYNEVPFHNFRHGFCVTQMVSVCARVRARVCVEGYLDSRGQFWRGLVQPLVQCCPVHSARLFAGYDHDHCFHNF